jgi:hypothetical protein
LLAFLGELPAYAPYAREAKRSSEIIGVARRLTRVRPWT